MVWFNNKLLVFSLTFFRYAQAVNLCSSGLLSCFAFESQYNVWDYELVYNQIPRNSLNSICRKMSSTFPKTKAKLDPPGCSTLQRGPGFSNLITISTRKSGNDTATGFTDVKNAFSSALECDSQEFASCQVVNTSASVFSNSQTSNSQTVWMSQPGDKFNFTDDAALILTNIVSSNTLLKFVDSTSNIANAMQMISMQLADQTSNYIICSSPIDQATNLVVVVDLGLVGSPSISPAEIGIGSGRWLVLLQGLVTAGGSNTGSIAGTYLRSTASPSPDLYISVSIDQ